MTLILLLAVLLIIRSSSSSSCFYQTYERTFLWLVYHNHIYNDLYRPPPSHQPLAQIGLDRRKEVVHPASCKAQCTCVYSSQRKIQSLLFPSAPLSMHCILSYARLQLALLLCRMCFRVLLSHGFRGDLEEIVGYLMFNLMRAFLVGLDRSTEEL